ARPSEGGQANDAHRGPLLVYEADLHLAVFQVDATQATIVEKIKDVGGYVQVQSSNQLVLRVPAARFDEALASVIESGDVLSRNVRAHDVGEQFRDINVRLRNAEAMRDRLEALLRQAEKVEDALAVERELERVTLMLESLKGQLRHLSDRIAFSTISIT